MQLYTNLTPLFANCLQQKRNNLVWMRKFSFFYEIFLHHIIYIQATLYVIKHTLHNDTKSVQLF